MPVEESLRTKKARLTRNALHEAAITRVLEDGLACATVATIAADAGVSTRTFFNYFETKEDAIVGLGAEVGVDEASPSTTSTALPGSTRWPRTRRASSAKRCSSAPSIPNFRRGDAASSRCIRNS